MLTRCLRAQPTDMELPVPVYIVVLRARNNRIACAFTRSVASIQDVVSLLEMMAPLLGSNDVAWREALTLALDARAMQQRCVAHGVGADTPLPPHHVLAQWALPKACTRIGVRSIVALLTAALLEHRILVVGPDVQELSAVALAVSVLLYPFTWHGVLIACVTSDLMHMVDAPVPWIIGCPAPLAVAATNAASSGDVSTLTICTLHNDAVELPHNMPQLPGKRSLRRVLAQLHAALLAATVAGDDASCAVATRAFCNAVQRHLEDRLRLQCHQLRVHSIGRHHGGARLSALLCDSYLGSLLGVCPTTAAFARALIHTTCFAALCDERLNPTPSA